ncbi:MAG: PqiC family protein, partial [Gammaproteobacteria bacterium]|nr:PqiC family protein [Gammaproteobacteria bacterium]
IIGPFQLAEYLDRPQIVMRDGANGMTMADYERWAEPLDANFQAVVTANVGRLLGSDRVLEFPAQTILKADRRVTGRVSRLDVDAGGLAVLEVQWGVLDGTGAVSRPGRVSRYEARATGEGAAARVAALNATVTAFSADLAVAVR